MTPPQEGSGRAAGGAEHVGRASLLHSCRVTVAGPPPVAVPPRVSPERRAARREIELAYLVSSLIQDSPPALAPQPQKQRSHSCFTFIRFQRGAQRWRCAACAASRKTRPASAYEPHTHTLSESESGCVSLKKRIINGVMLPAFVEG